MMSLYGVYAKELGIGSIFNPVVMFHDRTELPLELTVARIQTTTTHDSFIMKGKIIRAAQSGQPPAVNIVEQGWQIVK